MRHLVISRFVTPGVIALARRMACAIVHPTDLTRAFHDPRAQPQTHPPRKMSGVRYSSADGIAWIEIANPPVNALSHAVRQALGAAILQFERDTGARIAVIFGAGRMFIGGADISEFGAPPRPPLLPDVIAALEDCPKPVIAALHGTALGGGLEVALGAHYRLALTTARLGLPEVTLGILPGAGGTQRLPRLIGLSAAARMITSGAPITASEAHDLGLIDHLAEGDDLGAAATAYAKALTDADAPPRPTRDRPAPSPDPGLADLRATLTKRARGEVARLTALDAVQAAATLPIDAGLAEERRLFSHLMETPQRAGLIHAFFAERAASKLPEIAEIRPRNITRIGVIGGGTMGTGIATSALLANLHVTLIERDAQAADTAHSAITRTLDAAVTRGKLSHANHAKALAQLTTTKDEHALGDVDLAIEAVFEDMQEKQALFRRLDALLRPGAILATNTSYLDVNALADVTSRPADVIGLHFFSPAHIMKLLEVVVADATATEVTATAFALAKRLGKTPVRAGVCDGFIGNRILSHYRTAADHMVLDGASPYDVDRAMTAYGFAMGPFQVSDLAGLDIGYATRQRKAATAHPRDRVPHFADTLYHAGRLGQKTGRGYYLYEGRTGREDPDWDSIIDPIRAAANITPRTFHDDEIQRRAMAAMINEAARILADGIARRPSDIDVVLLLGYGFPRWRGGPMHSADQSGLATILDDIQRFAKTDDHFWTPAPLLEHLVREGRTFASLNTP